MAEQTPKKGPVKNTVSKAKDVHLLRHTLRHHTTRVMSLIGGQVHSGVLYDKIRNVMMKDISREQEHGGAFGGTVTLHRH